jgi:hypothetical protein
LHRSGGRGGEVERVVEFTVGQQAGVAGELGAMEFEAETPVELRSERLDWAVTHEDCSANGQEVVGNPGIRRVLAKLSCRLRFHMWEIRDQGMVPENPEPGDRAEEPGFVRG